jgi:hypothetical protein
MLDQSYEQLLVSCMTCERVFVYTNPAVGVMTNRPERMH